MMRCVIEFGGVADIALLISNVDMTVSRIYEIRYI